MLVIPKKKFKEIIKKVFTLLVRFLLNILKTSEYQAFFRTPFKIVIKNDLNELQKRLGYEKAFNFFELFDKKN